MRGAKQLGDRELGNAARSVLFDALRPSQLEGAALGTNLQWAKRTIDLRGHHPPLAGFGLAVLLRVVEQINHRLSRHDTGVDAGGHIGEAVEGALVLAGGAELVGHLLPEGGGDASRSPDAGGEAFGPRPMAAMVARRAIPNFIFVDFVVPYWDGR